MRVGFCIGVFDCFHYGHLRLIQRASRLVDKLIVAVVADEAVRAQKGDSRPVFPLAHRVAIIQGLQYPSLVLTSTTFDPYDCIAEYVRRSTTPIDVFIKGADQQHITTDRVATEFNIMVTTIERTPDISTTDIIKKLRSNQ